MFLKAITPPVRSGVALHCLGEDMLSEKKAANLKTVAARVGLAPCSVSAILNNTNAARAIPQATKDRVYRAARELNYRPNHWARSLRTRQTRMVALLAPDLCRSTVAQVVTGAQRHLHQSGYLLILICSDSEDGDHLTGHLQQRGIEGVIAVDAAVPRQLSLPVVRVDPGFRISRHSAAEEMYGWLRALGESAAQTVIQQIEYPAAPQQTRLDAKLPGTFFDSQRTNIEFTARAETA
jgi:DNA-binding LacI/PurR family transcriptional regulator